MEMPSDEQVDRLAESYMPEAEYDYVWLCMLCGGVERELNIRDHEQVKSVVLRVVAAMMAKGAQAGDPAINPARLVPWEDQSRDGALRRISANWDVEKWRTIGRYPDPAEIVALSKTRR